MRQKTSDIPISHSRRSGIVIAAIGLQLLLCSIASAANAAGDSLDRSARRLPAQMAQAIREMVERNHTHSKRIREESAGYSLSETPRELIPLKSIDSAYTRRISWLRCQLNLPPPGRC